LNTHLFDNNCYINALVYVYVLGIKKKMGKKKQCERVNNIE